MCDGWRSVIRPVAAALLVALLGGAQYGAFAEGKVLCALKGSKTARVRVRVESGWFNW